MNRSTFIAAAAASASAFASTAATTLLSAGALLAAMPAAASVHDGVRCPAGFAASYSDGGSRLVCTRSTTVTRDAICSPVTLGRGELRLGYKMEHVKLRGRADECRSPDGGVSAAQFLPLPGDPPHNEFRRSERADGGDVFTATRTEHAFPTGGPLYNPMSDAERGVACDSGFEAVRVGSNGLKCERRVETKTSGCDIGWTLRVDDLGRPADACIGINGAGQTVPQGVPMVLLQTQVREWVNVRQPGRDSWQKFDRRYPQAGR